MWGSSVWFVFHVCVGTSTWGSISWEASSMSAFGISVTWSTTCQAHTLASSPIAARVQSPTLYQCEFTDFSRDKNISSIDVKDSSIKHCSLGRMEKQNPHIPSEPSEMPYCLVNYFYFLETDPFCSLFFSCGIYELLFWYISWPSLRDVRVFNDNVGEN